MRRLLAALIVGALFAAACGPSDGSSASSDPEETTASDETVLSTTTTTEAPPSTTSTTADATTTTSGLAPQPGGFVVIAEDQEPPTLNPYVPGGDNFIVSIIGQAHMAGAYDFDAQTRELIPELVLEVPTVGNGGVVLNDDGTMTVRWLIRDEAVWSDGVPISGADFAFTLDFQTAANECWDPDAQFVPEPFDLGGEIEAVDAKTIAIRFDQTGFQHEDLFDWIVPKHAVEGTDYCDDWNDTTWPSAGPFVVVEWEPGSRLQLLRNPNYWKTDPETGMNLPYLDEVQFRFIPEAEGLIRAFRGRLVDVIQPPPAPEIVDGLQALEAEGAAVQTRPGPVWEHLNFQFGSGNRNPESLNEYQAFRQAIAFAIDPVVMAQEVGWVPIYSFVDIAADDGPWAQYQQDQDKAEELLDDACGLADRNCGSQPPVMVYSTTSNADERPRIASYLEDTLGRVGIDVELELEDSQLFFGETLDNGTWDVGWWGWVRSAGTAGAVGLLDLFDPDGAPPEGANYYRWGTSDSSVQDDAVDRFREVLSIVRTTVDSTQALALARAAEQILADSAVVVPVAARPVLGAIWADEIAGFEMNPTQSGHTWNIEFWRRIDL